MKKAFENDEAAPGSRSAPQSPAKNTTTRPKVAPKSTTKKAKTTVDSEYYEVEATPTPKRKRTTTKQKTTAEDKQKFKPEPEEEEDEDFDQSPKRSKPNTFKITPKPKYNKAAKSNHAVKKCEASLTPTTETIPTIKNETHDDDETFYDAPEHADAQFSRKDSGHDDRKFPLPS